MHIHQIIIGAIGASLVAVTVPVVVHTSVPPRHLDSPRVVNGDYPQMLAQCEISIKNRLGKPASAHFADGDGTNLRDAGGGRWIITTFVDVRYSSGTLLRSDWYCAVRFDSGAYHTDSLRIIPPAGPRQ